MTRVMDSVPAPITFGHRPLVRAAAGLFSAASVAGLLGIHIATAKMELAGVTPSLPLNIALAVGVPVLAVAAIAGTLVATNKRRTITFD